MAEPTPAEWIVTEAGVYDAVPVETYLADPVPGGSLSSSGARRLLPPSCPALYRHWATTGEQSTAAFDFGHAAHRLLLGDGYPIVAVDADDWRTKAAREQRDAARASGATPLLAADYQCVQAMAAALREHPVAGALFRSGTGRAEQSLFWTDGEFGVWRRARLDWLPNPGDGRLIIPEYKTCRSADPDALSRAMHSYGYHQQAAFYLDAVTALGLAGEQEPALVLVAQEKDPPHVVTVAQPDPLAIRWGRALNRKALDLYRRCRDTDTWPDHADGRVLALPLPRWAENAYEAALERGDYDTGDTP